MKTAIILTVVASILLTGAYVGTSMHSALQKHTKAIALSLPQPIQPN